MFKQFSHMRSMILTASIILLAAIFVATGHKHRRFTQKTNQSLNGPTGWLNTQQPLALANLHGKVILIDFRKYIGVNWRRTLLYVREWASKYKDQGMAMEIPFVFTHAIMLICLIGIICTSITGAIENDEIEKPSTISSLAAKIRSIRINTVNISRTVTALLTIFLR